MGRGAGEATRRRRGSGSLGSVEALAATLVAGLDGVVVFTGAGVSVSCGMSAFSTPDGLYERARRRFKVKDGMSLFHDRFLRKRRADALSFLAELSDEARSASPARTHIIMAKMENRIRRHVTLNVDGLFARAGSSIWHHERNPNGKTVEFHGNSLQTVCPSCKNVEPMAVAVSDAMKAREEVHCEECEGPIRPKIMLYDDEEGESITPSEVWQILKEDLAAVQLVLWVGISFEQSASVSYFRRIMRLAPKDSKMIVVNPSDDAIWNLKTAVSGDLGPDRLESLCEGSDEVFEAIYRILQTEDVSKSPRVRKRRRLKRVASSSSSAEND